MAGKSTQTADKKAATASSDGQPSGTTPNTALATVEPAGALVEADDFADTEGEGYENQSASLIKIPFGVILQPSSKIIKQPERLRDPAVRDAKAGQFHNTVTNELIDIDVDSPNVPGFLEILPVFFVETYVRWKPNNGGFNGKLAPDNPLVRKALAECEFGKWVVGEDDLAQTVELFYVYRSPASDEIHMAVINIASTAMKTFKEWNSKVSGFKAKTKEGKKYTPAMRCNRTALASRFEDKGADSFYRLVLEPVVKVDGVPDFQASMIKSKTDPLYLAATKFYTDLVDLKVAADYATLDRDGGDHGVPVSGGKVDKRSDPGFGSAAPGGMRGP